MYHLFHRYSYLLSIAIETTVSMLETLSPKCLYILMHLDTTLIKTSMLVMERVPKHKLTVFLSACHYIICAQRLYPVPINCCFEKHYFAFEERLYNISKP